ncbi:MAG: CorA family divalent cation transporter [Pirellulaceae bacterium]
MMPENLIPETWNVPAVFKKRLGDRVGRQRVFEHAGQLLIVAHAPAQPDESTRQPRLFWKDGSGEWHATSKGSGLAALQNHINEFRDAVEHCDQLEDAATTAKEYFDVLDHVAPLKRTIEHFHQVLEEARRLAPDDRNLINIRDQAYDVTRTAELLYDATRNGMEMAQTRRAEQQAEASMEMARAAHRLNWLVAMFFPLATICGIFGMQFEHGFEHYQAPWPLIIVCAIGILFGLILSTLVMRRR